jgi:phage-related tail fiber protein
VQTTYSILTTTGKNKEALSLANAAPLVLTELAFGDGNRIPSGGETALENELIRKPIIAQGVATGAPNASYFDALLEADDGPFVIREAGLFDQDGDMIAVIHYDPPINKPVAGSGQNAEAQIRTVVAFSDLENLVIQIQTIGAYVPASRQINTQEGLTGGGDLSADRTLKLAIEGLAPISASQIDMANDAFVLKDASAGEHKRVSPTEAAKALGGAPFATNEATVEGVSAEHKVHPQGLKAALSSHSSSPENRATRLFARVGL